MSSRPAVRWLRWFVVAAWFSTCLFTAALAERAWGEGLARPRSVAALVQADVDLVSPAIGPSGASGRDGFPVALAVRLAGVGMLGLVAGPVWTGRTVPARDPKRAPDRSRAPPAV